MIIMILLEPEPASEAHWQATQAQASLSSSILSPYPP